MVSTQALRAVYVGLFGIMILACLASLTQLSEIEDRDTRRSLGALLGLSACWSALQLVHVFPPEPRLAAVSHVAGLVLGLATIGVWLYFCSAYTGRSYHRNPRYRKLTVAVFLALAVSIAANPWHGLYFEVALKRTPFPYVTTQEQPVFWLGVALTYFVGMFGFHMLLEVFEERNQGAMKPALLVVAALLPIVFDAAGHVSQPPFLQLNYEAVGFGLFSIAVLFVVKEPYFAVSRFGRMQLVDEIDDPVLLVGHEGYVRDYNDTARETFPELADPDGDRLEHVADEFDADPFADGEAVELRIDGESRYFVVSNTPIAVGATEIGLAVLFTEITEIERQRRELRRKDEQLEGFATALAHELRNSVGIVSGQLELVSRTAGDDLDPEVRSRFETIVEETADMEAIVDDLNTLARYGQTISGTSPVDVGDAARAAHRRVDADELELRVRDTGEIEADGDRLRELFQNAFRFAEENGASNVDVTVSEGEFAIADDGRPLCEFDEEKVFAYGNAVPDSETALLLPNVRMLAVNHGWEVFVPDEYTEGAKIAITGTGLEGPPNRGGDVVGPVG